MRCPPIPTTWEAIKNTGEEEVNDEDCYAKIKTFFRFFNNVNFCCYDTRNNAEISYNSGPSIRRIIIKRTRRKNLSAIRHQSPHQIHHNHSPPKHSIIKELKHNYLQHNRHWIKPIARKQFTASTLSRSSLFLLHNFILSRLRK